MWQSCTVNYYIIAIGVGHTGYCLNCDTNMFGSVINLVVMMAKCVSTGAVGKVMHHAPEVDIRSGQCYDVGSYLAH